MSIDEELNSNGSPREAAEDAAASWIIRRGAADWQSSDQAALDAWLAQSIHHRAAYYRLNGAWEEAGRLGAFRQHRHFAALRASATSSPQRPHGPFMWAMAATIPLAVALASLWMLGWSPFDSNHFHTAVGGLEFVPLADGSRVTLNTDSDLRVVLTEVERKVELKRGEAYFEVAKDPRRPFVVDVGTQRIVAVGTAFSVFHQGKDTRVKVTEGIVRVEDLSGSSSEAANGNSHRPQAVLMRAGAQAQVGGENILVHQTDEAAVEQSLSWRSGILTFRDRPLSEVVAEFNRYNNRQLVIDDPAIASLQLGGVFRATNLDPFIELLEQTFPIHARPDGDRIVLTHN